MAIQKILKAIQEGTSFRVKPTTLKGLSELEDGADAVARLQRDFDLHTLDDGLVFAEPKVTDDMVNGLEGEIGALVDQEKALDSYGYKLLNGEVPGGESPIAHAFNNAATIGGITLPQRMLKDWQRLHDTADVINTKLMPKEFSLLPSTKNWDGANIKGGIWHVIANPKFAFDELTSDLVTKPTDLKLMGDKFGKHSRKVWKNLTKGMGNKDMEALNGVLAEGNNAETVLQVHKRGLVNEAGDVFEVSSRVQEAYFGTRMMLDHLYWLNNGAAVRQAAGKGYKLLDTQSGQKMVREVKGRHGESLPNLRGTNTKPEYIKWSKDHIDEGWRVVEMDQGGGQLIRIALKSDEAERMLKNIDNTHPMIPYRKGYVPVLYKDQWAVNRLVKMEDGSFRATRVATAPTRVKANKAVSEMAESPSLIEGEVEAMFVASRKNDISTDVAYGHNLHNIVDSLSQSELNSMKKALRGLGLEADAVDSLEKTSRFFSHKRNPYMMKRGPRLKDWRGVSDAEILPADEAIQKYMQSSSSYAANAEYMGRLEQKYLDEFGELLSDNNDFLSPVKLKRSSVASNGRTASEALLVRGQIERLSGMASDADRIIENFIINSLDKIAATRYGKVFDNFLDKLSDIWGIGSVVGTPSLSRGVARLKGFTATAKLGLWNLSQAVVQGTASLNVIGKNPIMAARATKDMMQAIGPEILKVGRTAKGRKLYEAIDNSGFIAGFDYVELQRIAAKGTDKVLGSKALRKLVDTNLYPYQLGEGGVRALAFFTERRILIDQIKKGKVSGLGKADIDGTKFLEEVNAKASITALNMSRVNQPLIARGIWGVPFQFKQFLVQQAEFMINPKNFKSGREMAGVWAAWTGAFGIQGMPWMFDIGLMVEGGLAASADVLESLGVDTTSPKFVGSVRRNAQSYVDMFAKVAAKHGPTKNYDDARAFWNRWAQSGLISGMTDGEFNIASRASLARVFTEYYGTQDMDDLIFGPGYQTAVMLLNNNVSTISDVINIWRNGDEFTPEYFAEAGARGLRGLPGLQHPVQAAEMMLSGQWRDSERRLVAGEPSLTQALLIGSGFAPDKRGERFERIEFSQRQAKAWKEWIRGRQGRLAKLSQEGHTEYAAVLLDDTLDQIVQVNPMLAKEFMMSYSHEMLRRNMTEDEKEFMYRHQDAEFFDSTYDNFFFERDTYIGWGANDD
jgi:hypothetical protein